MTKNLCEAEQEIFQEKPQAIPIPPSTILRVPFKKWMKDGGEGQEKEGGLQAYKVAINEFKGRKGRDTQ